MRLEYALTLNDPKSVMVAAIQARSTGSSHLSKAEVLAALGMCQSRARIGMQLLSAKYRKDLTDKLAAIRYLRGIAVDMCNNGIPARGVPPLVKVDRIEVMNAVYLLADCAVEEFCRTADTPGAKCRCGGRGVVEDPTSREFEDNPGIKTCPRCHGSGLKPVPAADIYRLLVAKALPTLSQSQFYAVWKLIYDLLVERCGIEESDAVLAYRDVTGV